MDLLSKNMGRPFRLNLGLYHHDEFVGWSWGFQESNETFYMVNSAVFPEHRRKGLYTRLMEAVVEEATRQGFMRIYGRHNSMNNAIIISKLKAGFVITSLEVSIHFGVLVHLSYFTKPLNRKMMEYRVGEMKPDDEIKRHLQL